MADTPVTANPGSGGAAFAADKDGSNTYWPYAKLAWGTSGNQNEVSNAYPLPVTSGPYAVTPGSASVAATGTAAVVLCSGPINGGFVINPATAAAQGLAATENAYLDMVASPGNSDSTANGTTTLLQPGQSFTLPPLAAGVNVSANAPSSGHKLTVNIWSLAFVLFFLSSTALAQPSGNVGPGPLNPPVAGGGVCTSAANGSSVAGPGCSVPVWHPGVASGVKFAAYVGAPGAACANPINYGNKVGRQLDYVVYYSANGSDVTKSQWQGGFNTSMPAFAAAGCPQNIVIKMGLITNSPSTGVFMTFESVAAGTWDTDYFQQAATAIANAGYTTPIIILGWEQNNGYSWQDNNVPIDGGSGTGLSAVLTFSAGVLQTAVVASSTFQGKNYKNTDTGLTLYGGTCSDAPLISVSTVNGTGGATALTVSHGGSCSNTHMGNGAFAAAFQHVSSLITATSGLSGAIIGFDPNCGSPDWRPDYPGDGYVGMIGIDCYDYFQSTNIIGSTALADGTVSVVNQPGTANTFHVMVVAGSGAITGGTITVAYNKVGGGTQSDVFPPAGLSLAASGEYDGYSLRPTSHINTITVANLAYSGSAPHFIIVADTPAEKWNNTLHATDKLAQVTSFGATTTSSCSGSPSPCNGAINITVGGSLPFAVFETGSTSGTGSGIANAGVYGGDDPYWQDQKFQYEDAQGYFLDLEYEAYTGPYYPTYGNGASYVFPGMAVVNGQDLP